ncbi:hypothetical protein, partial [Haloarchaeobius salinus]|uniref:hypothetical protein n=1 Tax=Haloarchaeobius salinus TaxID=1198298 RepID=UPI00210E40B6
VETDLGVAEMTLDDQHGAVSAFGPDEFPDLHEYTTAYLRDADAVDYPAAGGPDDDHPADEHL